MPTINGNVKVNIEIDADVEEAIRRIVREELAAHEERPRSENTTNKKPYYGVKIKA